MAAKTVGTGEFANSLLKLIFNATNFANMADNASSSPFTNLYVSLHTASPTINGSQATSEATYTGYTRMSVPRTSIGWTITTNYVSPTSNITFPASTGGSEIITYFGIGTASSGGGHLLYFGPISPSISITNGVVPEITTSTTVVEN